MPKASIGRVVGAVALNAILVGVTEVLLWTSMRRIGGKLPGKYYIIDLVCQCCFTVVGGYLCCATARPAGRGALFGLIALGMLIGGLSLPSSWTREPHWYRVALLVVWGPCVWIGWTVRSRSHVPSPTLTTIDFPAHSPLPNDRPRRLPLWMVEIGLSLVPRRKLYDCVVRCRNLPR